MTGNDDANADDGTSMRLSSPNGLGRIKINRPTTTQDDGKPTDDYLFDAKRIFRLLEDERYLPAEALHQSIIDRIENEIASGSNADDAPRSAEKKQSFKKRKRAFQGHKNSMQMAKKLLDENKEIVQKMKNRCILFKRAKKKLNINDDWTLAQTLFGVKTYYRHESDGSMSIKLEGRTSDCSLFDQVAVIREFDLNHIWAPFVTSSMTVSYLDKLDIVGWFHVGLSNFGLTRDALFRAIGCDSIYEDGSVIIVAQGIADELHNDKNREANEESKKSETNYGANVESCSASDDEYNEIWKRFREDPILDTLDLPPVPTRVGGGRLTIRSVEAQIHLESPTSAMTTLVANIDPNLHLIPQVLIDFVMKHICGIILHKMMVAAKNISKDPITNLHAIKIREEEDFYRNFLLPKFEGMCKIRGWQMPSISAFELSDAQLDMAEDFKAKQKRKSGTKAIDLMNSNNNESNLNEYLQLIKSSRTVDDEFFNDSSHVTENVPKVRTVSNYLDDMSDISKFSTASSFWRSNPIYNYRRQVGERTQLRKHREIQESRVRAAARLKPKDLNEDAKLRLEELRNARNRRESRKEVKNLKENGAVMPPELTKKIWQWNLSLSRHGFLTRIFVLQFLLVSLFCLLYLDTAFVKVIAVRKETSGFQNGRNIATLTYIGVAGLVHSIFCYIALIYAFSALQLGSIAGRRTRRFYSQYVHYVVAITSASMVGMGIIKPGMDQLLRWIVWNVCSIFESLVSKVPEKAAITLNAMINIIMMIISSTTKVLFGSNFVGRCILSLTNVLFTPLFEMMSYPIVTYVKSAIMQYQGNLDVIPWREDAFFTTRALLSHSAFFLLVILILFNIAAKQARKSIYVDVDFSAGKS